MNELDNTDNGEEGFRSAGDYAKLLEVQPEMEPIEARMSRVLSSESFTEALLEFPDKDSERERALGWAVEYMTLMRDEQGAIEYLGKMQQAEAPIDNKHHYLSNKRIEFFIESVGTKLGLEDTESETAKEQIFAYFRQNLVEDGYYYHGFNGVFEDSIRENGLDPRVRLWDPEQLQNISAIGRRVGEASLLGWADINSQGKTSITGITENVYDYADSSPEWFAQFVAEGMHMPTDSPYDKQAFAKRDYNAARQNIELLCERLSSRAEEDILARKAYPNLLPAEKSELMEFFETNWRQLAGAESKPKLALVERRAIQEAVPRFESYRDYQEEALQLYPDRQPSLSQAIYLLADNFGQHDRQITHVIAPKQLHIVDLPDYAMVHSS